MKTVKTVKTVCENCRETNENCENCEFYYRRRGGVIYINKFTVFTVFVCFSTVFTNGFHSFHSFHTFCSKLRRTCLKYDANPRNSSARRIGAPLSVLLAWCMHAHRSPPFLVGLEYAVFVIACVGGHHCAIIRRVTPLEELFSPQCLQAISSRWQEIRM